MQNYWKSLNKIQKQILADRAKTTSGYLRQVFLYGKKPGASMALSIEYATKGKVMAEQLLPEIFLKQAS